MSALSLCLCQNTVASGRCCIILQRNFFTRKFCQHSLIAGACHCIISMTAFIGGQEGFIAYRQHIANCIAARILNSRVAGWTTCHWVCRVSHQHLNLGWSGLETRQETAGSIGVRRQWWMIWQLISSRKSITSISYTALKKTAPLCCNVLAGAVFSHVLSGTSRFLWFVC